MRSRSERLDAGRALRRDVTRSAHNSLAADSRDMVRILALSNRGRIAHLVPIRYARMLHSPFAFMHARRGCCHGA